MVGTNADEGTLLGPLVGTPFASRFPGPETAEEYRALVRDEYPDVGDQILALYPADDDEALFSAINSLFGDLHVEAVKETTGPEWVVREN